jgi:hypothetical protein
VTPLSRMHSRITPCPIIPLAPNTRTFMPGF